MDEQYIKIIPLKTLDRKRVSRNKNDPLQRIKVNNCTQLNKIANYIQQLGNSPSEDTKVFLYAKHGDSYVKLPLLLTIFDYFMITELEEVMYSFGEITESGKEKISNNSSSKQNKLYQNISHKKKSTHEVRTDNTNIPTFQYPMPPDADLTFTDQHNSNLFSNDNFFQASSTDSQIFPLFHSGFSLFSNSFGFPLPNMDSQHLQGNEQENKQNLSESISLRKDLEQILRR